MPRAAASRLAKAFRLLLGVCLLFAPIRSAASPDSQAPEYQVKAAFLYNFAKFVTWPADFFSSQGASMDFCVLGQDPFGDALSQTLLEKTLNGRRIGIRRSRQVSDLTGCAVLFISNSETKRLPDIFSALAHSNVLTVGESEDFARNGGMIEFVLEDNRVRFRINTDAADRARLKISSKLLSLAQRVYDSSNPKGS